MLNKKHIASLAGFSCLIGTTLLLWKLGLLNQEHIQSLLQHTGGWAPAVCIVLYACATSFLIPSTPLNLVAGAMFGPLLGTVLTSTGAIIGAIVNFTLTRTVWHDAIARRVARRWPTANAEMHRGGMFYIFAMRLLPLIPYGIVSYAAGLTSVRFRDYILATIPGTVLGILPFVLIGSSGAHVFRTGKILPLIVAFGLTGILIAGGNFYRSSRRRNRETGEEAASLSLE
jgi:uncharacterized membrane protein YdjX (TVP38/TMEM64 family)